MLKLTPLNSFIFLLFLLILGVVILKTFPSKKLFEGLISYQETISAISTVIIPQYSATAKLYKLYDSLYYDVSNGNVIQLQGTAFSTTSNIVDICGTTITEVDVIPRTGTSIYTYTISSPSTSTVVSSSISGASLSSSYASWLYPNSSSYNSTTPYQIFYIPFGNDTYIHLYDISNTASIYSYCYLADYSTLSANPYVSNGGISNPTGYIADTDVSNNSYVIEPYYSSTRSVYQLSNNILFDPLNTNVIIRKNASTSSKSITVYINGTSVYNNVSSAGSITNLTSSISSNRGFSSYMLFDSDGQNTVLVLPNPKNTTTVVALLCKDSNNVSLLTIRNVVRFNPNSSTGISGSSGTSTSTGTTSTSGSTISSTNTITSDINNTVTLENIISNYYNKYYGSGYTDSGNVYSNDYILKTQIIPPICPACPTCPSFPSTVSCSDISSNRFSDTSYNTSQGYSDAGTLVGNVAQGTSGVIGSVAKGTANIIGGVAEGAEGVIGGVSQGASNIIGSIAGGTNTILRGNGNGTTGSGTLSYGNNSRGLAGNYTGDVKTNAGYAGNAYGLPVNSSSTAGNDMTSYYGAVPSKGSANYIPITADFSAFGR